MNPNYILLTGIKDPLRLENHVDSTLVDIAYAEPLEGDQVKILVEDDTDLTNDEVVHWILELVIDALRKNGEDEFQTEIVITTS